jgi:arylformamidase
MNVIDLSHPLSRTMPVYPGTKPPEITETSTLAGHGFAEKLLRLYSHTGTHLDAPAHLLAGAATLDGFPASGFVGPACVLDVSEPGRLIIGIADLERDRERIAKAEFALLHTGWAERWEDPSYFSGYPVLSEDAARWLAAFRLKGVGVDAISFDEMNSAALPVHRVFLGKNMVLVENLRGLESLAGLEFIFSCLPLPIAGGDGSPVRAVAIL